MKQWLIRRMRSRLPDYVVANGDLNRPYMLRWYLIPRNRVFNVYGHLFLRSDEAFALHDHPWANASWLLEGDYTEHLEGGVQRVAKEGSFSVRWSGKIAHRVELHDGPVWTVFFTGPVYRTWGFLCPEGWKPWRQIIKITNGVSSGAQSCND